MKDVVDCEKKTIERGVALTAGDETALAAVLAESAKVQKLATIDKEVARLIRAPYDAKAEELRQRIEAGEDVDVAAELAAVKVETVEAKAAR